MWFNLTESIIIVKALTEWRRKYPFDNNRDAAKSAQQKVLDEVREALDNVHVKVDRAAKGEE